MRKPVKSDEKELKMDKKKLDFSSIYKQSLVFAKKHVRDFSLILILVFLVNIINGWFDRETQNTMSTWMQTLSSMLSLMLSLISAWLTMWFINISLNIFAQKEVSCQSWLVDIKKTIKSLFASIVASWFGLLCGIPSVLVILIIDHYFPMIVSSLPLSILVIAMMILIIPIIFVSIRLNYATTVILDKDTGIREAIKTSRSITKGYVWLLFVFNLTLGLIQLIGVLTLGIWFFRTIPFMFLAQTLAYLQLRDRK